MKTILFAGGMLLIIVSALMFILAWQVVVAPYFLSVGVAAVVVYHFLTATKNSLRQYFLPVLAFLAAIYFMFKGQNSTMLMLFIAAVLEVYYAFRTKE
jgi:hypothetical protein